MACLAGLGKRDTSHHRHSPLRLCVYLLSGSALLATALILGRDFAEGMTRVHQLQEGIQQYEQAQHQSTSQQPGLPDTLKLLANLESGTDKPLTSMAGLTDRLMSFYSGKARAHAATLYREALQTIFLPALSQPLDAWLQKTRRDTPPGQLYQVLSARLMLAGKTALQPKIITEALVSTGTIPSDETTANQLAAQLEKAAQLHFVQPVDQSLLERARYQLTRLPVYQLGMLLLENNFMETDTTDNPIPLPALFTRAHFVEVMSAGIPAAATEALHGNDILGDIAARKKQRSIASATAELRNRYQQSYARIWVMALTHLTFNTPQDLFSTDNAITDLSNGSSLLFLKLKAISDNTSFAPINHMNPALQAINNLFAEDPESDHSQWHKNRQALDWMHESLEKILTSADPAQAAFQLVMQGMRNPDDNPFMMLHQTALQNPEPLKNWLTHLADTSWRLVVKESGAPSVDTSLVSAFERVRKPPIVLDHVPEKKLFTGLTRNPHELFDASRKKINLSETF